MAGIIYMGSELYQINEITVGDISAFLLYMIQLMMNFGILSGVAGNIFKVAGASEKIVNIMQTKQVINTRGGKTIPDEQVRGEVEFRNVNFCYPTKTDVQVTKNLSLKVN